VLVVVEVGGSVVDVVVLVGAAVVDVVVVDEGVEDEVEVTVRETVLDKLIELVTDCVAEGEGLAVIDMVYDPDGVPLEVFEAEAEALGLIVRVTEDDGLNVRVTVFERELLEDSEGEDEVEEVVVTVLVSNEETDGEGDEDKV
jgi:hypothetical protein